MSYRKEDGPQKATQYELTASGISVVGGWVIPDLPGTDQMQTQGSQDLPVAEAVRHASPDIQFTLNGIVYGKDPDIFRTIREQGENPARFAHQQPSSKRIPAEVYLSAVPDDDYEPDPEILDILRAEQQLVTSSQLNKPESHGELKQLIQTEIDPISDAKIRTEHYIEPPSIEI